MPIASYAIASDLQSYGDKLDQVPDDLANQLCLQASRAFDLEAQVEPGFFLAGSGSPSDKVFYGNGSEVLALDPFVAGTITNVTVPTGYTVPEYNVRGNYLYVKLSSRFYGEWSGREGAYKRGWAYDIPVTITAQWGLSEVPPDVFGAVLDTAVFWYRSRDPALLMATQEGGIAGVGDGLPPRAKMIAEQYASTKQVYVGV